MERSGGQERSGATRSHAQRAAPADGLERMSRPAREHGEDGEHRTLPGASTMARSFSPGGPDPRPRSGIARRTGSWDRWCWIIDQHSGGMIAGKAAWAVEHGQPPIGIFMDGYRRFHVMTAMPLSRNL